MKLISTEKITKGYMMKFAPRCDMLIDQNKFIGEDNMGHCCYNEATKNDGQYYFCDECLDKLADPNDNSITIPLIGSVKTWELMIVRINENIKNKTENGK